MAARQGLERASDNGPKTRAEAGTKEMVCRRVRIEGVTDIIFDRYAGDNDTKLEPWQKLYLAAEDDKQIVLPSTSIMSALSAQNTDSWPKRLLESKRYKTFCTGAKHITIAPDDIPFLRGDTPIRFGAFVRERDPQSGVYVRRDVARLDKGIPNPKVRPALPLPWALEFELTLWPNRYLQEQQLLNVFTEGLMAFGLGTYRGRFGKGRITLWE